MSIQQINSSLSVQTSLINALYGGSVDSSINLRPNVQIIEKGYSTASYAIDKTMEILKNDGKKLLHEPSITWVGRVFDWLLGLGTKEVPEKMALNSSEGGKNEAAISINDIQKKTFKIVRDETSHSLKHVFNCTVPEEGGSYDAYEQITQIFFNFNLNLMANQSNDPQQFKKSFLNCLVERVVDVYYSNVENLPSAKKCDFKNQLLILQRTYLVDFDVYTPGYDNVFFVDQTSVLFSESMINSCYVANLVQSFDSLPTVTIFNENGMQGSGNARYFDFFCTRRYSLQVWNLTYSSYGQPGISFPYSDDFEIALNNCSLPFVDLYFQWVEGNMSACSYPESLQETLVYPIGQDGSFSVDAPEGILVGQASIEFPVDGIQQCFNASYQEYSEKEEKFYKIIKIFSGVFLLAAGSAAMCAIYRKKLHLKCLVYIRAKCNKKEAEDLNYEEVL